MVSSSKRTLDYKTVKTNNENRADEKSSSMWLLLLINGAGCRQVNGMSEHQNRTSIDWVMVCDMKAWIIFHENFHLILPPSFYQPSTPFFSSSYYIVVPRFYHQTHAILFFLSSVYVVCFHSIVIECSLWKGNQLNRWICGLILSLHISYPYSPGRIGVQSFTRQLCAELLIQ